RRGELGHELGRGLEVRISGSHEDDERRSPFGTRPLERAIDAIHSFPRARSDFASAASLSPRPDRLITTTESLVRRGARLRSRAIACADSKAGMMPSVRASHTNESSASRSVTGAYSARPLSLKYECSGPTPG